MTPILIIPGWGNSGPGHWQSIWAETLPGASRVEMPDWHRPSRARWVDALARAVHAAVADTGERPILVGHSLGCLAAIHWATAADDPPVAGALLATPADAEQPARPALRSFAPIPRAPLPFPSIMVASDSDPYLSTARARSFAAAWSSRLILLRGVGHLNLASGHGEWPDGLALLGQLFDATAAHPSLRRRLPCAR